MTDIETLNGELTQMGKERAVVLDAYNKSRKELKEINDRIAAVAKPYLLSGWPLGEVAKRLGMSPENLSGVMRARFPTGYSAPTHGSASAKSREGSTGR